MFRNAAPVTEPDAPDDVGTAVPTNLIPLSVLQLDLDPPAGGWDAYLTGRGVGIAVDDIGRKAISRADARQLFDEKREAEARAREIAQRQEHRAVERDRAFRAALPTGLHWTELPPGVSAAEVWAAAERDAQPKRRTPLEDALAGDGMVYRPLRDGES
jgi:hypothetical protein